MNTIGRRTLLRAATTVGLGAGVLAGTAACTPGQPTGSEEPNATAAALPNPVPYEGVTPDLAGTPDGVLPAFFAYPASPAKFSEGTPAQGGQITALVELGIAPIPADRNAYWQELNKRLGTELKLDGAPSGDYSAKLATVVAGGTIPDFVQLQPQPRLADLLEKHFTDLSPHLSGDAIQKYPALSNLPQASWRSTMYNGRICGVPYSQGAMSSLLIVRKDIFESHGANVAPTSAEEFADTCKALTDAKQQRWALGNATPPGILHFVQQMFGAPNTWRETDGKFTSWYEGEETRQALDFVASLWRAGVFHPESFTGPAGLSTWFHSGSIAMLYGSYSNWSGLYKGARTIDPNASLSAMAPPRAGGGGLAPRFTNSQMYTFTAISNRDPDRVEELLSVMNWLAAPFGTEEYLFRRYGLPGVHHQLEQTDPILTEKGTTEIRLPIFYVANHAPVLYEPGLPDQTKVQHELQTRMVPGSIPPGNVGLQSDTEASKTAQLDRTMRAVQADVIQGRKTLADWDEAVETWRSQGGGQIRTELEGLQAAKGGR